jgi:hypothetical protein
MFHVPEILGLIPGSNVDETTSWSTVLLQNLMVAQLVERVLACHGHETLTDANDTCPRPDEFSSVLQKPVSRDSSVGMEILYGAGRSRNRLPVGERFPTSVQTGPGSHPAFCTFDTVSLYRVQNGRGVVLSTHTHLAPRLKKE